MRFKVLVAVESLSSISFIISCQPVCSTWQSLGKKRTAANQKTSHFQRGTTSEEESSVMLVSRLRLEWGLESGTWKLSEKVCRNALINTTRGNWKSDKLFKWNFFLQLHEKCYDTKVIILLRCSMLNNLRCIFQNNSTNLAKFSFIFTLKTRLDSSTIPR